MSFFFFVVVKDVMIRIELYGNRIHTHKKKIKQIYEIQVSSLRAYIRINDVQNF